MHWCSRDHIADDKLSIILVNVFVRPAVIVGLLFIDNSHHQHNFFYAPDFLDFVRRFLCTLHVRVTLKIFRWATLLKVLHIFLKIWLISACRLMFDVRCPRSGVQEYVKTIGKRQNKKDDHIKLLFQHREARCRQRPRKIRLQPENKIWLNPGTTQTCLLGRTQSTSDF